MSEPNYEIILTGEVLPGLNPVHVSAKLGKLFNISHGKAVQFLNHRPHRIKTDVPKSKAKTYVETIEKLGAECTMRPVLLPGQTRADLGATPETDSKLKPHADQNTAPTDHNKTNTALTADEADFANVTKINPVQENAFAGATAELASAALQSSAQETKRQQATNTGKADATDQARPANPEPGGKQGDKKKLSLKILRAAFSGEILNQQTETGYSTALMGVGLCMLLLPVVYFGLLAGVVYGTYWHVSTNHVWLDSSPHFVSLVAYGALAFAGAMLAFFMVKPVFQSFRSKSSGQTINLEKHPLLSTFIKGIAKKTGAPMPVEIRIIMDANAYAAPKDGLLSLFRSELTLGIGLPLLAGCNTRQLAGIIAHEMGHFSQKSGMHFGYIIMRINSWFHDCVYLRDSWDDKLDEWFEKYDDFRAWFLMSAKFCIWSGRQILALFLKLSTLLSQQLAQQMEFDADKYECAIAGSGTFADSSRRLKELALAQHAVYYELWHSWQEGRLSEDFMPLLINKADNLEMDDRRMIDQMLNDQEQDRYATHPPDGKRIDVAEKLALPGIFQLQNPAWELISDFTELSKQNTLNFYHTEWHIEPAPNQLISAAALDEQVQTREDHNQSLEEYMGSMFRPDRAVVPENTRLTTTNPDKLKIKLSDIIQEMRSALPAYRESLLKHDNLVRRLAAIHNARIYLNNKVPFNPEDFYLEEASSEHASATWVKTQMEYKATLGKLEQMESVFAQRMGLEFVLLSFRDDEDSAAELQKLKLGLTALAGIQEKLMDFFIHASTLANLVHEISHGHDMSDDVIDQDIKLCLQDYEGILDLLQDTPYPFTRGDDIHTIRGHIVEKAGEPEKLKQQFHLIWDCYTHTREACDYLNQRIMSRFTQLAQNLEDELEVAHFKQADVKEKASNY